MLLGYQFIYLNDLADQEDLDCQASKLTSLLVSAYEDQVSWHRDATKSGLQHKCHYHYVISHAGEWIAYAQFQVILGEAELFNLVVDPNYQGKGLGQALLVESLSHLEGLETNRFLLEVRETNMPARRLYEKNGFKPIGIRENYYKIGQEAAIIYLRKKENT